MKSIIILALASFLTAFAVVKERKTLTVEVKYLNDNIDTLVLKSVQSPICIADYENGEACLIVGKDSVVCCDVMDFKVISVTP